MSATSSTTRPRPVAAGRTVSAPYMVWVVMSMATPLTVFTGIIVLGYAATGLTGIPAAFILVGFIVSLFFTVYTRMAPLIGNPGSFAGYIAHGLGRIAGVGGAGVALVAYSVLLWGLFGYLGPEAAPLAKKWLGWDLPWWTFALAAWALVAWVGHLRVRDAARVVGVLLGLEITAIVVFSVTNLLHPMGGVVTTDTLSPTSLVTPGRGSLLALAFIGYIGIESIVVFAKECADPQRTVPRAAYVTILLTTVIYAGGAWALSVATGPDGIVGAAQAHGTDLVFHLARPYLGSTAVALGKLLLLTSILAAAIGFHNAGARYLLALGKEHVLPRRLGITSPKTGAPVAGSRVQSVVTLLVIVVYAVFEIEPVRHLFYWAGGAGAIGVLMLMTATAWSIVLYFARNAARSTPAWWWAVAALAALGVSWVLIESLANFALLIGEPPSPQPTRIILLVFGSVAAIGATWALWLRFTRNEDYRAIGLGGPAVPTGTSGR